MKPPNVDSYESQTQSMTFLLLFSSITSWIGYVGLFFWLSWSVFPYISEWLKIIFR